MTLICLSLNKIKTKTSQKRS